MLQSYVSKRKLKLNDYKLDDVYCIPTGTVAEKSHQVVNTCVLLVNSL